MSTMNTIEGRAHNALSLAIDEIRKRFGIRTFPDGSAMCAVFDASFTNIQDSPCGFAKTERGAIVALILGDEILADNEAA